MQGQKDRLKDGKMDGRIDGKRLCLTAQWILTKHIFWMKYSSQIIHCLYTNKTELAVKSSKGNGYGFSRGSAFVSTPFQFPFSLVFFQLHKSCVQYNMIYCLCERSMPIFQFLQLKLSIHLFI